MLRCAQYKALPISERSALDLQFLELARNNRWKRCPGCQSMVEREDGCFFMTCSCRTRFCYECGMKVNHLRNMDLIIVKERKT
jgi:ornithine carbamoyltransferase